MPYKYSDPYRHKFEPKKYKVKNWCEYNKALKQRGDITIWFTKKSISRWYARSTHKQGAQPIYSNTAIETAGIVRLVFHLPLRQTTGFLSSVAKIMGLKLRIPDYSTLSRRFNKLKTNFKIPSNKHGVHIIFDTTGLSVYDAVEFHQKKKEEPTRFRGFRKLHIAINEHQEIVACELTDKHADDKEQASKLLRQVKTYYNKVIADGNYDDRKVYAAIEKLKHYRYIKNTKITDCSIVIPPRCNAWPRKIKTRIYPKQRSDHINYRNEHGKINWQKATGYGERSLVEVAFYRYKKIIGRLMHSIDFNNQKAEARLACKVLNTMTGLGMPQTEVAN